MQSAFNFCYHSFKIFPQFWLAKSTRAIHHNQLLMTNFGRILCLTRGNDVKNAALYRLGYRYREDLRTSLSFFGCEKKWRHFTRFKSKNYRWN